MWAISIGLVVGILFLMVAFVAYSYYDSLKDGKDDTKKLWAGAVCTLSLFMAAASALGGVMLYQKSNVWAAEYAAQVNHIQVEAEAKTEILYAQSRADTAVLEAQAEIIRAQGVKESAEILIETLGGVDQYLRYLSIKALSTPGIRVVYAPTEFGIPLEASRFFK